MNGKKILLIKMFLQSDLNEILEILVLLLLDYRSHVNIATTQGVRRSRRSLLDKEIANVSIALHKEAIYVSGSNSGTDCFLVYGFCEVRLESIFLFLF